MRGWTQRQSARQSNARGLRQPLRELQPALKVQAFRAPSLVLRRSSSRVFSRALSLPPRPRLVSSCAPALLLASALSLLSRPRLSSSPARVLSRTRALLVAAAVVRRRRCCCCSCCPGRPHRQPVPRPDRSDGATNSSHRFVFELFPPNPMPMPMPSQELRSRDLEESKGVLDSRVEGKKVRCSIERPCLW